jgi:DNA-binding HxlR family transcriptional regulator
MTPRRRSYRQFCGVAKALDVVGERWTLLLVRELLLGPRRYGDLLDALPGLTTNLLADRLRGLTAAGLIEQVTLPAPASATAYQLTAAGAQLEPVIMALGAFGSRYLIKPARGERLDLGWGLLSMKRRYRGAARPCTIEVRVGARVYQTRLRARDLDVRLGAPWAPDCTIAIDAPDPLRALLMGGASAAALESAGQLRVTGDRSAFATYLEAFGLQP